MVGEVLKRVFKREYDKNTLEYEDDRPLSEKEATALLKKVSLDELVERFNAPAETDIEKEADNFLLVERREKDAGGLDEGLKEQFGNNLALLASQNALISTVQDYVFLGNYLVSLSGQNVNLQDLRNVKDSVDLAVHNLLLTIYPVIMEYEFSFFPITSTTENLIGGFTTYQKIRDGLFRSNFSLFDEVTVISGLNLSGLCQLKDSVYILKDYFQEPAEVFSSLIDQAELLYEAIVAKISYYHARSLYEKITGEEEVETQKLLISNVFSSFNIALNKFISVYNQDLKRSPRLSRQENFVKFGKHIFNFFRFTYFETLNTPGVINNPELLERINDFEENLIEGKPMLPKKTSLDLEQNLIYLEFIPEEKTEAKFFPIRVLNRVYKGTPITTSDIVTFNTSALSLTLSELEERIASSPLDELEVRVRLNEEKYSGADTVESLAHYLENIPYDCEGSNVTNHIYFLAVTNDLKKSVSDYLFIKQALLDVGASEERESVLRITNFLKNVSLGLRDRDLSKESYPYLSFKLHTKLGRDVKDMSMVLEEIVDERNISVDIRQSLELLLAYQTSVFNQDVQKDLGVDFEKLLYFEENYQIALNSYETSLKARQLLMKRDYAFRDIITAKDYLENAIDGFSKAYKVDSIRKNTSFREAFLETLSLYQHIHTNIIYSVALKIDPDNLHHISVLKDIVSSNRPLQYLSKEMIFVMRGVLLKDKNFIDKIDIL